MRKKIWMILIVGIIVSAAALARPTGSIVHEFGRGPQNGFYPVAGLIADNSGNLYGTTHSGGGQGFGTVFELTHTNSGWDETILYSFCSASSGERPSQQQCPDGKYPEAPLTLDGKGNLYGTTMYGGNNSCFLSGCGVAFELSLSNGRWAESVLYDFVRRGHLRRTFPV